MIVDRMDVCDQIRVALVEARHQTSKTRKRGLHRALAREQINIAIGLLGELDDEDRHLRSTGRRIWKRNSHQGRGR